MNESHENSRYIRNDVAPSIKNDIEECFRSMMSCKSTYYTIMSTKLGGNPRISAKEFRKSFAGLFYLTSSVPEIYSEHPEMIEKIKEWIRTNAKNSIPVGFELGEEYTRLLFLKGYLNIAKE